MVPDLQQRLQAALGDAFRLERELTRGGMSRLFLATEASLNRQVVVKAGAGQADVGAKAIGAVGYGLWAVGYGLWAMGCDRVRE